MYIMYMVKNELSSFRARIKDNNGRFYRTTEACLFVRGLEL